ncbi:hypothetical protein ACFX2I_044658 [Malus domestica]
MLKSFIVHANGEEDKANVGTATRLVSGGLAGAVAQTVIYPMDLVKTRIQTYTGEGGRIPSLKTLCREIWVYEGPQAFYKDVVPCLLGMIPYAGIDLAAYETLKDMSKKYIVHDREPGALVQLGYGTVSGALGATCVYPLHVVRRKRRTFQHEGLRGFYKGIFPDLLKVVPPASITYMIYESMKKSLDLG